MLVNIIIIIIIIIIYNYYCNFRHNNALLENKYYVTVYLGRLLCWRLSASLSQQYNTTRKHTKSANHREYP